MMKKTNDKKALVIDLPAEDELGLDVVSALQTGRKEGLVNHLYSLVARCELMVSQANDAGKVGAIMLGMELLHQKAVNQGSPKEKRLPWKQWVAENCAFSHKTATKYQKVAEAARAGLIDGLDPEEVPELAPSEMDDEGMVEASRALLAGLEGKSLRQLYLELDMIKASSNTIEDNRGVGKKKVVEEDETPPPSYAENQALLLEEVFEHLSEGEGWLARFGDELGDASLGKLDQWLISMRERVAELKGGAS